MHDQGVQLAVVDVHLPLEGRQLAGDAIDDGAQRGLRAADQLLLVEAERREVRRLLVQAGLDLGLPGSERRHVRRRGSRHEASACELPRAARRRARHPSAARSAIAADTFATGGWCSGGASCREHGAKGRAR